MTASLTRAEELRNDLDNLHFTARFLIGNLAELEDMGQMGSKNYLKVQRNLNVVKSNIKRIEAELQSEEEKEYESEVEI